MCNHRYREILAPIASHVIPGVSFEELLRASLSNVPLAEDAGDAERWIAHRLEHHRNPPAVIETHRADGSWLQIAERRTDDGGIVVVMTDITASKMREGALEKNSLLLQATLDSLSHGLCVVDRNRRLIAWNRRFVELFELPPERLQQGMAWSDLAQLLGAGMGMRTGDPDWLPGGTMASPPPAGAARRDQAGRPQPARAPQSDARRRLQHDLFRHHRCGRRRSPLRRAGASQRLAGRRGVLDLQRRAHHRSQSARQSHRVRQPGLHAHHRLCAGGDARQELPHAAGPRHRPADGRAPAQGDQPAQAGHRHHPQLPQGRPHLLERAAASIRCSTTTSSSCISSASRPTSPTACAPRRRCGAARASCARSPRPMRRRSIRCRPTSPCSMPTASSSRSTACGATPPGRPTSTISPASAAAISTASRIPTACSPTRRRR